jgi:hypothetical protein
MATALHFIHFIHMSLLSYKVSEKVFLYPSLFNWQQVTWRRKELSQKGDKNDSTTATIRKKLKTQMSLQQSLEVSCTWDINSAPTQQITKLISEIIVLDNQPYVMDEDMGFVCLMKHIGPRYHIPDWRHFSETVIPNLAKKAEATVSKLLDKADHVSFTSDIWTCSHNNDTFISLVFHLLHVEPIGRKQTSHCTFHNRDTNCDPNV